MTGVKQYQEDGKLTLILVVAVFISVFGSSFQYGYNIAVMNAPAPLMQSFFFGTGMSSVEVELQSNNTSNTTTSVPTQPQNSSLNAIETTPGTANATSSVESSELTTSQLFMWSFTVSIYTVGGMVGSYLTGVCIKYLGRKGAMLAANALSITAAILEGTSKAANSLEMVIIARFLLGIFAGLATGVVPLYNGEISPKKIRGAIGVVSQLFITVGILTAQLLSLNEAMGTEELWPLLLAFTAVPSITQLCVLPFIPESPRCLLLDKNDQGKARAALIRFRGTNNVAAEIQEMKAEAAAETATRQLSVMELIRDRYVRWQLISIVVLQITQQLCGINAIFFYLNTIFEAAGVPEETRNYASVGVGSVNTLMTIVSVLLMDRAGRKALLAGGYAISGVFCALMTVSLTLQDQISWMSNMSIACVIGFIVGFAIGPGPVPWILTAELFRQSGRPAASAIGCGVNWTSNFILALVFPFMQKAMGSYVFVFFLVICVIATAYVMIVLPETKNETFQDISLMFAKRNGIQKNTIEMDNIDDEANRPIVKR
uniref:Solute carrier family 2, facilitated glucose transporter member 5-like n=1 Tax=Phallusia mammillata TaxID=59560 RepID=A0A6F9DT69_9ASCI|nr:solute carrier family 2, facilitated glucose transporter member 5-like [Phallusia mammillata]